MSLFDSLMSQLDAIASPPPEAGIERDLSLFSDVPEGMQKAFATGIENTPNRTPLTAHGFKWPAGLNDVDDRKIMLNVALNSRRQHDCADHIRRELKRCPAAMARLNTNPKK